MSSIPFAEGLKLPLDAVTQTFAFLARKGAGKTYGASKLAEGMLAADAQVVVIDPVGVWYGLRLGADGKTPGFNIPVFGGLHGDLPLEPTGGALVADLVVDQGTSLVLDVSMFRKNDRKRFVTDFAEQLFHRKKGSRSPMHLFVEEAQVFVPQRVMGDEARMLGAFEDLVKLGRNFGIGVTLISQRPQAVNKDALNQTECLVVLQTNGAQERKAISEWIVEQGLDVEELVDSLPALERGEAWVWSPSWLRKTVRVHIQKKKTFNASATPEVGKKQREPRQLEPIDLDKIREAMAATVKQAEANDPKALRAKVAKLEAELAKAKGSVAPPVDYGPLLAKLDALGRQLSPFGGEVRALLEMIVSVTHPHQSEKPRTLEPVAMRRIQPVARGERPVSNMRGAAERTPRPVHSEESGDVPPAVTKILEALAGTTLPHLSRRQVGTLAGIKATTGTFRTYLSILRTRGLIRDVGGGALEITPEGLAVIGGRPSAPATPDEVIASWKAKLPPVVGRMLDAIVEMHPKSISRSDLAERLEISATTGTFRTYLSLLRTRGLIETHRDEITASESLFLSGAA